MNCSLYELELIEYTCIGLVLFGLLSFTSYQRLRGYFSSKPLIK